MKRVLLTSAVFFFLSGGVYAGSGTSCRHYAGHASVEGKWGSERNITETAAFLPLACREDRLLYGDVRLKADNRGNREGNVGVGLRSLKDSGVAGGYVYLDRRRSGTTEKLFTQTTLGAEWLAEDWEVRGNAYVPLSGKKQMGTSGGEALGDPYLANNGIYVDVTGQNAIVEKPLWGADAEAGLKLPGKDFWLHAGAFAFDASEVEGLAGGRLRATYKMTENIALTAEGQYDTMRGRQGWLGVRYTVPFGDAKTKYKGLKNRMTADPVRDVDIVTAAVEEEVRPGYTAQVVNTETEAAQRVIHVDNSAGGGGDGTLENPFNTLAAAEAAMQDHDVIYINRGTGTSVGMNTGLSVARDNVWVIGSGADFIYDGGRFRAPVEDNLSGTVLIAGGLAPVITNVNVNGDGIYVTGADTYIGGVTVDGAARHGIYALADTGADLGDLIISDVTSSGNTGSGLFINAQAGGDIGNVTAQNAVFQNNLGANGWGIQFLANGAGSAIESATFRDVTVTGNANRGIYALVQGGAAVDTLEFDNITSQNNNGTTAGGLVVSVTGASSRLETARISNSLISNNVTGGLIVQSANGATLNETEISNVTANGNGGLGMYLNAELAGTINSLDVLGVVTNNNTGNGIHVRAASNSDIGTVTLDDITSQNNTGASVRGIEITAAGAGSGINDVTIQNATLSGNTDRGAYISALTAATIGTLVIDNLESHHSVGSHGLEIGINGAGATLTAARISNSEFYNNSTGAYIRTENNGLLDSLELTDVSSHNNTGRGFLIHAITGADINTIEVEDMASQSNAVQGMEISSQNAGSTIGSASVRNSSFTGNSNVGLSVNATTASLMNSVEIESVTSSGNASRGVYVAADSDGDIGAITITDTTAQNNTGANGVGVQVLATGAGSTVTSAVLDNITVSGNANAGIYGAGSTNGVLSSIEVKNSTATGGLVQGILFDGVGNGTLTSAIVRDSIASGNTGAGVSARGLTGGDIGTFIARNMTVINNTGRGITATAEAANSILSSVTIEDSLVQDNDTDGGIYVSSTNTGLITSATISDVQVTNNVNRGVYAVVLSGGDIGTLTIDNVTSTNNTAVNGRGIQIQADGNGSTITTANVTNSSVSGNVSNGLYGVTLTSGIISSLNVSNTSSTGNGANGFAIDSQTGGQTYATLNDVTASGNTATGIYIVSSGNSTLNTRILNSTSTGSGTNGLYIDDDTTGAYILDVGGGTLGSTGNNRIFSNTGTEVRLDFDNGGIKAENNWWGNAAGLQAGELTTEAGTIDTTPFLAADPGP
ncbi:MAG: hypothetical protein DYH13_09200 [Alphaproteobacteria bacterium PRO2]|nr:hypothetical protein [Alphaproteobacteria bacterium PRO2]